MSILLTPYANLDPNLILSAVESLGYQTSGNLSPLNSYENRVYQVGMEEAPPLIVKFYRPGRWTDASIHEEHHFALELQSHEIPVVAPIENKQGETLHQYEGYRFSLFPRRGGHALELDNMDQLEWVGRIIGRIHAIGATRTFQHRLTLNTQTYGEQPYQFLIQEKFIPEHILPNYSRVVETLLEKITACFALVGELPLMRLHGDFHAGNVLWTPNGTHVVDLDDCLMGPAIQDIWMLLSGNPEDVKVQLKHILDGYHEFYDFNYRELKLVEVMRSLRMIHYSAWLARRWGDPAFPLSFPWFNTPRYWEEQLNHLNEQVECLDQLLAAE